MFLNRAQWDQFSTYLYYDRKLSRSKGSLQSDRSRFGILADYFCTKEFNRTNFTIFISELKDRGHKNTYINNFIKLSKHLCRFIGHEDILDFTYFRENPEPVEILTPIEIKNLCKVKVPYARNRPSLQKRWDALLTLISITGCRVNEALSLTKNEVFSDYVIFKNTKSGRDRIVPIPAELANNIRMLPNMRTCFDVLNPQSVAAEMKKRGTVLGITKRLYPHVLRHSFVTTMLQYADSLLVARIVGHEDPSTTQRYNHANLDQLRTIQMYHPLLRHSLTLHVIADKMREYAGKLIDNSKYRITFSEGEKKLRMEIEL